MPSSPESPQLGFDEFKDKPVQQIPRFRKPDARPVSRPTTQPKEFLPNGRGEPGDSDYVKPDNRY